MTTLTDRLRPRRVVVGVDTHKHVHVAVALDQLGARLGTGMFTADRVGYADLIRWAVGFGGAEVVFAIEGTGSYGAGLTSAVRRAGIGAVEVMRTDRRDRRLRGKSDTIDAENAAGSVLAGTATAVPKDRDGTVEMIRQVKVAKDVAVKARTASMISLKQVLVNAPPELREELEPLSKMTLIRRCAALRPGEVVTVTAAAKHTLRSIARRWLDLDTEIKAHEKVLTRLTTHLTPQARRRVRCRPGHRRRDAHRRRRQRRPGALRARLGQALRRRPYPGLIGTDHPAPAQPRRAPPRQHRPLPGRHRPHAAPRPDQGLRCPGACQIHCGRVGVTSTAWGRGAWRITHDF